MVKGVRKRGKKSQAKTKRVYKAGKKGQVNKQKARPSKVFIYALALAALGGGGYLVYDRMKRKKIADQNQMPNDSPDSYRDRDTIIINNTLPASYNSFASRLTSVQDNFPLKRGSRGSRVKMLQQALSKTTPSILIDGIFGSQTATALKTAGYPEFVDEALYNTITGVGTNTAQLIFNPAALAVSLYRNAQSSNLDQVLSVLQQLKSVSDYTAVNDYYKKQSFISKTIVTDLLEYAFKNSETARTQIRKEFLRIGLKVNDGGMWTLQGIPRYKDLITIRATVVSDAQNNRIPVRRNTILGDEISVANGMTWFRSIDHSVLKVPTQDVKYT